jgi:hypothetical protein
MRAALLMNKSGLIIICYMLNTLNSTQDLTARIPFTRKLTYTSLGTYKRKLTYTSQEASNVVRYEPGSLAFSSLMKSKFPAMKFDFVHVGGWQNGPEIRDW